MGKKNKNKFKKQIKAQLAQEVTQAQSQIQAHPNKVKTTPDQVQAVTNPETKNELDLKQIKYDLKKTGLVVLILIAVIVALYFLDLKYGILLHFGSWLFRILNIK